MTTTTHRTFKIADLKAIMYRYLRPDIHMMFHSSQLTMFEEAFTHRSLGLGYSYERLEFLGDSLASCVLTGYIFRRFVKEDEAFLSRLRSHLISGKVYAEVSKQVGLPGWLRITADNESLRLRPNVQEDLFESFIGAMYLTYGYPITEMWTVSVFEEHVDISSIVRGTLNPRERLTNYCLAMYGKKPVIEATKSDSGDSHVKVLHPESRATVSEAHSAAYSVALADACDRAADVLFASHGSVVMEACDTNACENEEPL